MGLELDHVDVDKLVAHLNDQLKEGTLSVDSFEAKPRWKPSYRWWTWDKKEIDDRGVFPLILTGGEPGVIEGTLSLDAEKQVGYIYVEKGWRGDLSKYQGNGYEVLELRLKKPLKLKNGALPPSRIRYTTEFDGWNILEEPNRFDRLQLGQLWFPKDLYDTLPSYAFEKSKT
ncbi:MAG: hypothetical protein ABIH34_05400 [Nanoarchaeota archaeon]